MKFIVRIFFGIKIHGHILFSLFHAAGVVVVVVVVVFCLFPTMTWLQQLDLED